jgi:hypothetical protein
VRYFSGNHAKLVVYPSVELQATDNRGFVTRSKEKHNPYYSDYHVWNDSEVGHYQQWSRENHRDSGRDFRKLPPEEQKEYWTWRHSSRGQRSSLVSLACL